MNFIAASAQERIQIQSDFSFEETSERLTQTLGEKNIKIFAVIDHHAEASTAGLTLLPTRLIIFGSPKVGTLLMQEQQSIGLDLPLKMLITEDVHGRVWLTYIPVVQLQQSYALSPSAVIENIGKLQQLLAQKATKNNGL
ncbi:DUF302 domain-containing protein [Riemerella columbipharyngis]|nr:DUF302 domain-containing protein [Riemerella columbipharyngis]